MKENKQKYLCAKILDYLVRFYFIHLANLGPSFILSRATGFNVF